MTLYSTPAWRTELRQFLNRRKWGNLLWAEKLNARLVLGNRSLSLTEYGVSRWRNNDEDTRDYRGPKAREDYVGLAHALIQLEVISQREAFAWLLLQGLYPLPDEAAIFGSAFKKLS